jgi:RNA polymerase sigma-70 factor (ECF subfamily)
VHEAVAYAYEQSRKQLRAVAARYVGDDAEDVVQDAFVSALRYGNTFRGDSAPLTWLYRIVTNRSIDHCRRRNRRDHPALGDALRPARADAAVEESLALRTALRWLTPEQCRVFVMYDVLGHTHVEIARLLAIPLGTSKSRLSEARRRLREALSPSALS